MYLIYHPETGRIAGGMSGQIAPPDPRPDEAVVEVPDETEYAGMIVQNGALLADPMFDLTGYKPMRVAGLLQARNAEILAGLVSPATGTPHTYPFDPEAQANMTGQLTLLNADPSIGAVDWATEDAGIVSLTRDQFIQLCKDGMAHKRAHFERYWTLAAQVEGATTKAEVDIIVW